MKNYLIKVIVLVFAVIGGISSFGYLYRFIKSEAEARRYRTNCESVKIGMSVLEVKKVMGDYQWFNKTTRSEVWLEEGESKDILSNVKFSLSYPSQFGASGWPMIYFDPCTNKVTQIICGE